MLNALAKWFDNGTVPYTVPILKKYGSCWNTIRSAATTVFLQQQSSLHKHCSHGLQMCDFSRFFLLFNIVHSLVNISYFSLNYIVHVAFINQKNTFSLDVDRNWCFVFFICKPCDWILYGGTSTIRSLNIKTTLSCKATRYYRNFVYIARICV